jgi:hypothetical protein
MTAVPHAPDLSRMRPVCVAFCALPIPDIRSRLGCENS